MKTYLFSIALAFVFIISAHAQTYITLSVNSATNTSYTVPSNTVATMTYLSAYGVILTSCAGATNVPYEPASGDSTGYPVISGPAVITLESFDKFYGNTIISKPGIASFEITPVKKTLIISK